MNKFFKRLALLLAVLMIVSMMPVQLFADNSVAGEEQSNGTGEASGNSNAVAKIGDTGYESLADAIVAANGNGTVTLLTATTELVQALLDGQYGSIDGLTIELPAGDYGKLELGRATKYAGSNTEYFVGGFDSTAKNYKAFTNADEIREYKGQSTWTPNCFYRRALNNVTIKAADNATVTIEKISADAGQIYGKADAPKYDYVLDVEIPDTNKSYWMALAWNNVTFEGINFKSSVNIESSSEKTLIDGLHFENCKFNSGYTALAAANDPNKASKGMGIRFVSWTKTTNNLRNLTVNNCTFEDCSEGVYTNPVYGVSVTNSSFNNINHNAVAIQDVDSAVNHGNVVISGNTFTNVSDRIIRFNNAGEDTTITITGNTSVNSGDSDGEIIKATTMPDSVNINMTSNTWGDVNGKTAVIGNGFNKVVVALVGGVGYTTLADAIANANPDANGVITYEISGKANVDSTGWIQVARAGLTGLTKVEFVGKTPDAEICITNSTSVLADQLYDIDVSFTALVLSHPNGAWVDDLGHATNYFACLLRNTNAAENTVTYTNCTFPNGLCNNQYGKTVVDDCKFTNATSGKYNLWNYGGNTEIKNSTFTGVRGIKTYNEGILAVAPTVKIENTTFNGLTEKAAIVASKPVAVTVENVSVSGDKGFFTRDITGNDEVMLKVAGTGISGIFNITSDTNAEAAKEEFNISAGTFTSEVSSDYLADGFEVKDNGDGTYGVAAKNYVAAIGDAYYSTLQEAIDAATRNSIVTLLADTKENVTISTPYVTLDLNGHTLNGSTGERKPALTVTARVTVKDSSEAQTGTIMREDTAENSGVSSHYVIDIQGNGWLTFESGNVTNDSGAGGTKGASLVRVGSDSVAKYPGLNIKGGTFKQDNFIVIKVERGDLFLNGGSLNSANSYAVQTWHRATIKGGTVNGAVSSWTYDGGPGAETTISGGTVNGNVEAISYDGKAGKPALVSISGGTVNGTLIAGIYNSATEPTKDMATIEITGGTFSSDPTKYLVEGSTVTPNSDGTFGVEKAYLAQVGENKYYTMDEAFKAQTASGEPIVLLRDYTTGSTFNSGTVARVVDLNGHTWTCTGTDANSAAFEINNPNASLTVKNGKIVSSQLVGLIPSAMGGTIKYDNSSLTFENVQMSTTATSGIETNGNNTNDTVKLVNSTLNVPNGFGIYFPSSGELIIENSKITAKTMGVQVCSGALSISGANTAIIVTGDAVEKTENDGAIQDGAAISIVNRTGYKGLDTVTVSGGKFTAKEGNSAIKAYNWANNTESDFTADKGTVAVSGGTFSSEVSEDLCVEGSIPTKNADGTYGVKAGKYVAQIGSTKYETLEEAIVAANAGETVTLLADVTADVAINKNITLDLGGKTLTNTGAGKATISIANGATATVKNGNVIGGATYYNIEVTKGSNANLTLEDVIATAGNTGSSMIDNWGTLTITSGTYTGGLNVVKSEEGSTLVINGGKFTLEYATDGYTGVILTYGTTTITGGEFIQSLTTTGRWAHPQVVATGVVEGYPAITKITGGTFTNKKSGESIFHGVGKATSDNFEVSGGTFNKSIPESFCAEGFIPTKNADGTYGVKEGKFVVEVGSTGYETFDEAIAAANASANSTTIYLRENLTVDNQIIINNTKGKKITLNLKSFTLTSTYAGTGYSLLTRTAVTIKNGTYKSTNESARGIGAVANFVLDGVTVDVAGLVGVACSESGKTYAIKNSVVKAGYAVCNFANNATITISDSTLTGTGNVLYHNGSNYGLKLTVTNSTITGTSDDCCGVYISGSTSAQANSDNQNGAGGYQQATFTKCTISGTNGIEVKYTDLTLDGCTVISTSNIAPSYTQNNNGPAASGFAVVSTDNAMQSNTPKPEGTIIVKGEGKYTGPVGLGSLESVKTNYAGFNDETIKVSGGTFSSAVPEEYCADGFIPTKNADGTYGVKEGKYVAQIGNVKYETLAEAIAAAKDGDTVKLLDDVDLTETLIIRDKTITLDLNGKTISNSTDIWNESTYSWSLISVRDNGDLTIDDTVGGGTLKAKENDCFTLDVYAYDTKNVENTRLTVNAGNYIGNISAVYAFTGKVTINGGHFSIQQKESGSDPYRLTLNCYDSSYTAGRAGFTVNGGMFENFDPRNNTAEGKGTSFVADGVGVDAADGSFTAVPNMAAQIVDADGNSVAAYTGHYDAIAAAKDGEKVILLSDRKNFVTNTINANITIDLNGKTLSVGNNNPFFRTNGEVTIQNGTITSNMACVIVNAYNKLTLKNVKITGVTGDNGKNLVNVCSNAEVTIDKDTVLTASGSNGAAVFIGQDADAKYTLNVYGKVIQESKSFAISGNGSYKGTTTINIYDGAEVKSASVAIYHPQAGVINVNGGLVEGYCAIGIKSGTLNINGGTVRGTADDHVLDDSNSTSGTITYDGSAIIVDSRSTGYAGNVNINVTGGTVESYYSTAIREIGEQDKTDMTQLTKLNVTGGSVLGASKNPVNVTSDMLVRDISVINISVSGGTFNHAVPDSYCANRYIPTQNADGTYGVQKAMKGSEKNPYTLKELSEMTRAQYIAAQEALSGTMYVEIGNYSYDKDGVLGNGVRNDTPGQTPDHSKLNAYGENGYFGENNDGANGKNIIFVGGSITSGVTGYTSIDNIGTSLLLAVPAYTNVTFEGVTFKNVISFDYQLYTGPWSQLGELKFSGCTFNGIIVGAIAAQTLTFDGCEFTNYTNTTAANSSNPTWIRPAYGNWTKGDNEGQGNNFKSLTTINFTNNTVTSTRPVKFERIAQWEMDTKVTVTGNEFDIKSDGSSKNVGLYFGANAKFDLVVDNNKKTDGTAALYTAVYKAPNGTDYAGLPAGSTVKDSNGADVEVAGVIWKTTDALTLKTTTEAVEVGGVKFATLEEAFAAAKNGDTITLLDNVDMTETIKVTDGKKITLALNGFDVTIKATGAFIRVCNAELTITGNGTIKERNPYFAPIIIKGGAEGSENYSVVNIKEGVTLEGWAGVMIDQTLGTANNYGMVLNVEGATLNGVNDTDGASGSGIYVNGVVEDAKITLTDTTVTGTGTGMYLAGNADTTINGGSVKGDATGIEIRAGKLTLNNCDVTGGNEKVTADANGNGTTVTNAALAISQHTTKKPIEVIINGGTFNGTAAVYQTDVQNTGSVDVKIAVNDGTFNGTISGETDGAIVISGGKFKVKVDDKYFDGNHACSTDTTDGYYTVAGHPIISAGISISEDMSFRIIVGKGYENGKLKYYYDTIGEDNTIVRVEGEGILGTDTKGNSIFRIYNVNPQRADLIYVIQYYDAGGNAVGAPKEISVLTYFEGFYNMEAGENEDVEARKTFIANFLEYCASAMERSYALHKDVTLNGKTWQDRADAVREMMTRLRLVAKDYEFKGNLGRYFKDNSEGIILKRGVVFGSTFKAYYQISKEAIDNGYKVFRQGMDITDKLELVDGAYRLYFEIAPYEFKDNLTITVYNGTTKVCEYTSPLANTLEVLSKSTDASLAKMAKAAFNYFVALQNYNG